MSAVVFENIDIVFGDRQKEALALIDQGRKRDEILKATNVVLGAAGVNLAIEPGEICVLMGLSGSGKSTILRAVNGLNKVARGRLLVRHGDRDIDVARCTADNCACCARAASRWCSSSSRCCRGAPSRRTSASASSCAAPRRARSDRVVAEKLAMVGLTQWASKFGHELSGGMQQRVGLARAFATDADILLMDEPFSALDPLIRDKLQDELLLLQKDLKKTIIFVSHDLDEAMKLGNRIAILEGGRIVQCGRAEEILLHPADDYVAEFVKHMNPLNVLRGGALMTPAAALVARRRRSSCSTSTAASACGSIAEGRPVGCTLDGQAGSIGAAEPPSRTQREVRHI